MDVLLPLFQLLYFVAHFLASLALSVHDTFHTLLRLHQHLRDLLQPGDALTYRIQADAAQLKKVPQHVGVVCVGRQGHSAAQFAGLVGWAVGFGVSCVSLYDIHGALKRQRSAMVRTLQEACVDVNLSVVSYKGDGTPVKDTILRDPSKPSLTLNLLSLADGRGNLAAVARKLSASATAVSAACIECHVVGQGLPHPEVVITVGEPATSLGFLPWHIRLTEFFSVPSLTRLQYGDFLSILRQYSRCEQRYGK